MRPKAHFERPSTPFSANGTAVSRQGRADPDAYALARDDADAGIPWAGLINPDNPNSGPYGGTSLVWFPGESTALVGFGVGTRGISPDEGILTPTWSPASRGALASPLAMEGVVIWSKGDPAALRVAVPKTFSSQFPEFAPTFKRMQTRCTASRRFHRSRTSPNGLFNHSSGSVCLRAGLARAQGACHRVGGVAG